MAFATIRPLRSSLACSLAIIGLLAGPAPADTHHWDAGNGDWSVAGNWSPAAVPDSADDVFIGSLVAAENDFVSLDQTDTIASLSITDGMVLLTDGFTLLVNGDTVISGRNQIDIVIYPSRLRVSASGNSDDFDTNNLLVQNEAGIDMDGGILEVDNVLTVEAGSSINGSGVIDFGGTETRIYWNDGNLQAGVDGLVLNQNSTGRIDLDGNSGNGTVHVATSKIDDSAHATLDVNGDLLADSFSSTMTIGSDNVVTMNLSGEGWTADANSQLNFFGASNDPSTLAGSPVTVQGSVRALSTAVFNADATFGSTAAVEIGNNDQLQLNGTNVFDGASFAQDGVTTGGTITMNGDLTVSADTTIDLPTGVFDWDGDLAIHTTNVDAGVTFVINADVIDDDPVNDPYDSLTNIGVGATVTVNTTAAWRLKGVIDLSSSTLDGSGIDIVSLGEIRGNGNVSVATLDNSGAISAENGQTLTVEAAGANDLDGVTGNGTLNAQQGDLTIQGIITLAPFDGTANVGFFGVSRLFLMPTGGLNNTGDLNLDGGVYQAGLTQNGQMTVNFTSRIVSNALFDSAGTNSLSGNLELEGDSVVAAGAVFNGIGDVIVLSGSQLNGAHNAVMGVDVDNSGQVEPGTSLGLFQVTGFTNQVTGTLEIELESDGGVLGVDHDLLDVRGQADLLGGKLEVDYLNAFVPTAGDTFLVLRTLTGVNGTFDTLAQPLSDEISLGVIYDATTVTLATYYAADFDEDGDVDADDLVLWDAGYGLAGGAVHMDGDANGDMKVDGGDFLIWQLQLGLDIGGLGAASVPEPTTAALAVLLTLLAAPLGRRS